MMSGNGSSADGDGAPAPDPAQVAAQVRAECLQDLVGCLTVLRQRNTEFSGVDLTGNDLADLQEILDMLSAARDLASPLPARFAPYKDDPEFSRLVVEFSGLNPVVTMLYWSVKGLFKRTAQAPAPGNVPPGPPAAPFTPSASQTVEIKIRKFSGQRRDWHQWWAVFEGAVHNNDTLTLVQKFHYLVDSIEGTAKRVIGHPKWTPEEYASCIERLQNEYADTTRLERSLHDAVRFVTPPADDRDDLHDFTLRFTSAAMDYKSNIGSPLADSTLTRYLEDLLPLDLRSRLFDRCGPTFTYEEAVDAL